MITVSSAAAGTSNVKVLRRSLVTDVSSFGGMMGVKA